MTDQEIATLVDLLGKCTPGNLPPTVFNAVARLSVMAAIEFVPLRHAKDEVEVLLLQRPRDDLLWANMLHTPGTILRPGDTSFKDGFDRLLKDELTNINSIEPQFIGFNFGHGDRGSFVTFEYILDLTGHPTVSGHFFPATELPPNFIPEQRPLIQRAVSKFQGH